MKDYEPAEVYAPGETIAVELEARGWTPSDLADILGKSTPTVSRLLNGKVSITPEMARDLSEAFKGTSPEFWLALDAQYQLRNAKATPGTDVRSYIYSKAPVREMVKRQWIEPSADPAVLQSRVCQFLGIASLDEEPA